jgi:hypothetical protein
VEIVEEIAFAINVAPTEANIAAIKIALRKEIADEILSKGSST